MGLPYFIEYLLTLERPGGGRLTHVGLTQTIIPIFPPATTLNYQSRPRQGMYATIWFKSLFSPVMVPNAFTLWGQQYGAMWMSGTVTQLIIEQGAEYLIMVTEGEPYLGSITNVSGLNQYWEGTTVFLNIASEEDLKLVRAELRKLTSAQANELLDLIEKKLPPKRGISG